MTASISVEASTLPPTGFAGTNSRQRTGPPALVCVAHGSRDPEALRTVSRLLTLVRSLRPGLRVELGHIEIDEPLLPATLASLPAGSEAVLVPLLFSPGHHVTYDIPQAAADAAGLHAAVAAPLGPHPLLAEALSGRLAEAGLWDGSPYGTAQQRRRTAVVLAAAGSRDAEATAGTERIAAQLSVRLGGVPVLPAYASAASPTVPEAVAALRDAGHRRIGVASCFTAPGRFAARCAAAAPGPAAAPVGAHPAAARLVLHRYDETAAALASGPAPDTTAALLAQAQPG